MAVDREIDSPHFLIDKRFEQIEASTKCQTSLTPSWI